MNSPNQNKKPNETPNQMKRNYFKALQHTSALHIGARSRMAVDAAKPSGSLKSYGSDSYSSWRPWRKFVFFVFNPDYYFQFVNGL